MDDMISWRTHRAARDWIAQRRFTVISRGLFIVLQLCSDVSYVFLVERTTAVMVVLAISHVTSVQCPCSNDVDDAGRVLLARKYTD